MINSSPRFSAPVAVKRTTFILSVMEIADTPDCSITDTSEICWYLFYECFNCFFVVSHTNERRDDRLIDLGVYFACFLSFFVYFCDILECFCVERTAEFNDDFAGKFWADATRFRESF